MGTPRHTTRRALTAASLTGTAGTAVAIATAAPARAADTYAPGSYPATAVLSAADRHLVNRFSYGVTPALTAAVTKAGGGRAWFAAQLAAPAPSVDAGLADWWPDLKLDPGTLRARDQAGTRGVWRVMLDYAKRLTARRMLTTWQVREAVTEALENHLHVPAVGNSWSYWRVGYGDVVRQHALGRYADLLAATALHPAMLVYLDTVRSTAKHPNENQARELLELHTVGVGAFTEQDVQHCAKVLSGWSVGTTAPYQAYFDPKRHALGAVSVVGFTDANAAAGTGDLARRMLTHLAQQPATARRVASRLATAFVSDTPSAALVEHLAGVYLAHDTRLVPVLQALVAHPEFLASDGAKLRDPAQDAVATHRVLGVTLARPASPDDDSAANLAITLAQATGTVPMAWPRPDGVPMVASAWSSAARVLASLDVHWGMANGTWPVRGITWRSAASWVPRRPIAFRDLVDHLARSLHGKASDARLLQACCEAVGLAPTYSITASTTIPNATMGRLLAVFLDHPDHLHH